MIIICGTVFAVNCLISRPRSWWGWRPTRTWTWLVWSQGVCLIKVSMSSLEGKSAVESVSVARSKLKLLQLLNIFPPRGEMIYKEWGGWGGWITRKIKMLILNSLLRISCQDCSSCIQTKEEEDEERKCSRNKCLHPVNYYTLKNQTHLTQSFKVSFLVTA